VTDGLTDRMVRPLTDSLALCIGKRRHGEERHVGATDG
jgi:hypothetical protein